MHPSLFAQTTPEQAAIVMASSGERVSYAELDRRSIQAARLFRRSGLTAGDVVAVLMENNSTFLEAIWAAERIGLYFTAISTRLTADEIRSVLRDSGAKILIASAPMAAVAKHLTNAPALRARFAVGGTIATFMSYEAARDAEFADALENETPGAMMLYSSGTTGKPKGVKPALNGGPIDAANPALLRGARRYDMDANTTYLCPAPLYHAAPLGWSMAVHRSGGTVVIMEKFDAEDALAAIERHQITHAQFVPTHFVRFLKLPARTRTKFSHDSLRVAFHAAAPCPIPIKEQMLEWWGPIIHEYYSGTEGIGQTAITPQEWIARKGSVGRATIGQIRICDENGDALPVRREGAVYFEGGPPLSYHNAPEKVAENTNKHGWTTFGDIGWLDEDGYLYLTDRQSFMIVSGGVNVYPQEIEDHLVTHSKVADAAVVGAPDEDMGERVVAVVQPVHWSDAGAEFADELRAFCRARFSGIKTPRQFDFTKELPRHPTGKLYKRLLRDRYWAKPPSA
jgi:long-chain acyl-CoA synthetase